MFHIAGLETAVRKNLPMVVHVEVDVDVDVDANSMATDIPGFLEFRTWYGEEGNNLGVIGDAAAPSAASKEPGGSGY
jgi:acetolactate synthase I/II/III large subunit